MFEKMMNNNLKKIYGNLKILAENFDSMAHCKPNGKPAGKPCNPPGPKGI
jgi:hypothetical protein